MKIPFVPISGWEGDNMIEKSANMPWYKGPYLLEALDKVKPPNRPTDKALRLPLQDVYKIGGIGTVPVGRVETGIIKPGIHACFAPSEPLLKLSPSRCTTNPSLRPSLVTTLDSTLRTLPSRIFAVDSLPPTPRSEPAASVASFEAQVIVMNHPGQISNGYSPVLDCHTAHVACKFANIKEKMDRRTGKVLEENPKVRQDGRCLHCRP